MKIFTTSSLLAALFAFIPTTFIVVEASSMAPVVWNSNNEATVVFCQSGSSYGYKLEGDVGGSCDPAGILVRMSPGNSYKFTLKNEASEETNIHTHGLHISGDGNADDPRRKVDAGNCLTYYWDIPSNHMGGTYWMHSHAHTKTQAQVSGGAFAMLIIEEGSTVIADSSSTTTDEDAIRAWYNNELLLLASLSGNNPLGNGLSNYQINMNANEWYRMRIAAVDPSGTASTLVFPSSCTVHAAAHDGVWRFLVPKPTSSSSYSLTGSSRLDVAIKCSSGGTVTFGGKNNGVATLNVGGSGSSFPNPFKGSTGTPWSSYRPNYLLDLRGMSSSEFETYSISMTAAQINGQSYDPNVPLGNWNYGTFQEWTISSTKAHPYHLHVYHMQAISGCGDSVHDAGEYYDSISVNSGCVVRFHMIDYAESIMMHCHVLSHEDNGSMTWANVVGGPTQSTFDRDQKTCPGGGTAPSPTPPPTPSPTEAPGGGCSLAQVGESCRKASDCCSGSCSGGNPNSRVCLAARYLRRLA